MQNSNTSLRARCRKENDGNEASDELVSNAYGLYGAGFLSLTNLCGTRLAEYVVFMTAYIHVLVDIYKADRDLRARIQTQQIAI